MDSMKIPKRLVIKIAISLIDERGVITQYDIYTAIEEHLKRQLTIGEKIRITKVVESKLFLSEIRRDKEGKKCRFRE